MQCLDNTHTHAHTHVHAHVYMYTTCSCVHTHWFITDMSCTTYTESFHSGDTHTHTHVQTHTHTIGLYVCICTILHVYAHVCCNTNTMYLPQKEEQPPVGVALDLQNSLDRIDLTDENSSDGKTRRDETTPTPSLAASAAGLAVESVCVCEDGDLVTLGEVLGNSVRENGRKSAVNPFAKLQHSHGNSSDGCVKTTEVPRGMRHLNMHVCIYTACTNHFLYCMYIHYFMCHCIHVYIVHVHVRTCTMYMC